MPLPVERLQGIEEDRLGRFRPALQQGAPCGSVCLDTGAVHPRTRHVQVQQLERKFELLGTGFQPDPLVRLTDAEPDLQLLPSKPFAQREGIEFPSAALLDQQHGFSSGPVQRIRHQRMPAGAERPHDDLVLLELCRLDHHPCPVGEGPLQGISSGQAALAENSPLAWRLRKQRGKLLLGLWLGT